MAETILGTEARPLVIGTRGSDLALWQARFLQSQLAETGVVSALSVIRTKGDDIQHLGFDKMEGKGFFTKEIEDALLLGSIDVAVHSMKDLPTEQPEGLVIAAVSYREDPADWLLVRRAATENVVLKVKKGGTVGTSSARRKAQLLHLRPDLRLQDIRGNVPTRLQKLRDGQFDAILLAAAGVSRLNLDLSDFDLVRLNPKEFVPAPAQGVLAFQTSAQDLGARRLLQRIHHSEVAACTNVERGVLRLLQGGCQMPVGVYCERDALNNFHAWAALATSWDAPLRSVRCSSSTSHGLTEAIVEALRRT
jgi:hydroxymethylbilane synthase